MTCVADEHDWEVIAGEYEPEKSEVDSNEVHEFRWLAFF